MEEKIRIESKKAAKRLLQALKKEESIKSKEDKQLIEEHVKKKFA